MSSKNGIGVVVRHGDVRHVVLHGVVKRVGKGGARWVGQLVKEEGEDESEDDERRDDECQSCCVCCICGGCGRGGRGGWSKGGRWR